MTALVDASAAGRLDIDSMAELEEVILSALDRVGARAVVEVGADSAFTRLLGEWGQSRRARVWCIERSPSPELVAACDGSDAVQLVMDLSPLELESLPCADSYVVSGDHNYYTVSGELEAIHRSASASKKEPVVFVNSVGWPHGRRDSYRDPDNLPAASVHAHTRRKGVTMDFPGIVDGGYRGGREFAFARSEGGAGNGVLTAVEAFLDDHPDYDFRVVPCFSGLGVVFPRESAYAPGLREHLEPWDSNPLLARLEEVRLRSHLRILALEYGRASARVRQELAARRKYERRTAETEQRVQAELSSLERVLSDVRHGLDLLFRSRILKALDVVERGMRRSRSGFGTSRERIARLQAMTSAALRSLERSLESPQLRRHLSGNGGLTTDAHRADPSGRRARIARTDDRGSPQ